MANEERRCPIFISREVSIPATTTVKLYNENKDRRHLLLRRVSTNFYASFDNINHGADLAKMDLFDANYIGEFFDAGIIPISSVHVRNDTGTAIVIQVRTDSEEPLI